MLASSRRWVKLALRELLDVLTRPDADRAALIGRLSLRADGEWLAEPLIDREEGRAGAVASDRGAPRAWSERLAGHTTTLPKATALPLIVGARR